VIQCLVLMPFDDSVAGFVLAAFPATTAGPYSTSFDQPCLSAGGKSIRSVYKPTRRSIPCASAASCMFVSILGCGGAVKAVSATSNNLNLPFDNRRNLQI
jgi:hypothetical protein